MAEKEGAGTTSAENESADREFEPTVEMYVNEYDDERTLDEEEAMEASENREEEINNLVKERDMPLEDLLAMYGTFQGGATEDRAASANGEVNEVDEGQMEADEEEEDDASRSSESEENLNPINKEPKSDGIKPDRRKKPSELVNLYPELDANGETGGSTARSLRSGSRQQSEDEEDDGEEGSGEEEEDWRKTIMIGSAYQAQVPEGLQEYDATPPYENEDKLLWEPGRVSPFQVEEYLSKIRHAPTGVHGIEAVPVGTHTRDNEQALHLLLQCGYNVEEALRRYRMNPGKVASCMTLWSEEECRNFENGLKTYGKDFHLIQQNKVRTRSVGELVQFYYLWKKTERHDMFATKTRIEKKKYFVHPGTTDYMDRFLDEGEGITSGGVTVATLRDFRSGSPGVHSLLYGKCPPGVAPPIPTSTVASATLSFVTATPILPHQQDLVTSTTPNNPCQVSGNVNHSTPLGGIVPPALNHLSSSLGGIPSISSQRALSPLNSNGGQQQGTTPLFSENGPRVGSPSSFPSSTQINGKGESIVSVTRGTKRSHSPSVDMNVSISHSLAVHGSPSSTSLGVVDTKSHSKAETVAL